MSEHDDVNHKGAEVLMTNGGIVKEQVEQTNRATPMTTDDP